MSETETRLEWARQAHDAMHELRWLLSTDQAISAQWPEGGPGEFTKPAQVAIDRAHDALHQAIGDKPLPVESTTADTRPFDRAFGDLCREHEVVAVWVAAVDGKIFTGGHREWNETITAVFQAGMTAMTEHPTSSASRLWTPNPGQT